MKPPHPGPPSGDGPSNSDPQVPDRDTLIQLGMRLFMASLVMLFAASLVAYIILRSRLSASLQLPPLLWASTGLLAACGVSVALVQRANAQEAWGAVKAWAVITAAMSLGFLTVQVPALQTLLAEHDAAAGPSLYGMTCVLIALHGLHVLGGMVPLGYLLALAWRGNLDRRRQPAVRACCQYWHFLEVVWAIMFGLFLIAERW